MVMKFFADLEKNRYVYTPNAADSYGAHDHMPDGSLRVLPATHRKLESIITKERTQVSVVYIEVTTEAIYGPSFFDVKYKVSVEKKAVPRREESGIVDIDENAALNIEDIVVGFFDRKFDDIENGKNVLLSCLGREELLY